MQTQLEKLKQLMAASEHRAALKLAAGWAQLGEHKEAIERGWAAATNPNFYREIGKDPVILQLQGITAIRERYGIVGETTA